ncbi:hypothetical protein GQ43DRAFT_411905 [Delitschia confertaspora ATCC 74209]|uniref:HD/PDEase domain-containing protein n=1 Tax=Delitschia confertaspora ATCC 74209 TaxID=1513339 RepID=A0A9P4JPQ4_9PLEO|nr:hypothetical protein GQ43DRAFT_411905 [Delitschia confertaspora ATCC 74209]
MSATSCPVLPVPQKHRNLLKSVNSFVREYMSHYDSSHDYQHILRVVSNANTILQAELESNPDHTFDNTALFLAALLHDVGDHKYAKAGEDVDSMVANVLRERGASEELARTVQRIVKHVGWTNETKDPNSVVTVLKEHPELAIVQDADRLDAIGAVGVGRCFTFTGAKCPGRQMTDAIDHFEEKLYKLGGAMKTDTGKAMAESRTKILRDLADQFTREATLSFDFE